ncbi:MAG: hypothetical protein JSS34_01010 [Proteobacteria bacterium]|nr:hypothetical protein [Pseudomonadota bacterium]
MKINYITTLSLSVFILSGSLSFVQGTKATEAEMERSDQAQKKEKEHFIALNELRKGSYIEVDQKRKELKGTNVAEIEKALKRMSPEEKKNVRLGFTLNQKASPELQRIYKPFAQTRDGYNFALKPDDFEDFLKTHKISNIRQIFFWFLRGHTYPREAMGQGQLPGLETSKDFEIRRDLEAQKYGYYIVNDMSVLAWDAGKEAFYDRKSGKKIWEHSVKDGKVRIYNRTLALEMIEKFKDRFPNVPVRLIAEGEPKAEIKLTENRIEAFRRGNDGTFYKEFSLEEAYGWFAYGGEEFKGRVEFPAALFQEGFVKNVKNGREVYDENI